MTRIECVPATAQDADFINGVYLENIAALHGAPRSRGEWEDLLTRRHTIYYNIVYTGKPVGWFRLDLEDDGVWLGMLQVKPALHRRGIGRAAIAAAETMARARGASRLGIHTTEDNLPARALYVACGYTLAEIGPCTTADGVERIGYTFCKNI